VWTPGDAGWIDNLPNLSSMRRRQSRISIARVAGTPEYPGQTPIYSVPTGNGADASCGVGVWVAVGSIPVILPAMSLRTNDTRWKVVEWGQDLGTVWPMPRTNVVARRGT
jgi:hypothetical protein